MPFATMRQLHSLRPKVPLYVPLFYNFRERLEWQCDIAVVQDAHRDGMSQLTRGFIVHLVGHRADVVPHIEKKEGHPFLGMGVESKNPSKKNRALTKHVPQREPQT